MIIISENTNYTNKQSVKNLTVSGSINLYAVWGTTAKLTVYGLEGRNEKIRVFRNNESYIDYTSTRGARIVNHNTDKITEISNIYTYIENSNYSSNLDLEEAVKKEYVKRNHITRNDANMIKVDLINGIYDKTVYSGEKIVIYTRRTTNGNYIYSMWHNPNDVGAGEIFYFTVPSIISKDAGGSINITLTAPNYNTNPNDRASVRVQNPSGWCSSIGKFYIGE